MSRDALARAAGVSTSMLARLELQDRAPRLDPIVRIARELGLSLDDLAKQRTAP
jgi:transcriptional regulator with XRE-family HTH domain